MKCFVALNHVDLLVAFAVCFSCTNFLDGLVETVEVGIPGAQWCYILAVVANELRPRGSQLDPGVLSEDTLEVRLQLREPENGQLNRLLAANGPMPVPGTVFVLFSYDDSVFDLVRDFSSGSGVEPLHDGCYQLVQDPSRDFVEHGRVREHARRVALTLRDSAHEDLTARIRCECGPRHQVALSCLCVGPVAVRLLELVIGPPRRRDGRHWLCWVVQGELLVDSDIQRLRQVSKHSLGVVQGKPLGWVVVADVDDVPRAVA